MITVLNKLLNRKYEVVKYFEAGMVLNGSELPCIWKSRFDISSNYVRIENGIPFINDFSFRCACHKRRDILLLLKKREIFVLNKDIKRSGLTIVLHSLYNKKGLIKVKICSVRGKKLYTINKEDAFVKDIQRWQKGDDSW